MAGMEAAARDSRRRSGATVSRTAAPAVAEAADLTAGVACSDSKITYYQASEEGAECQLQHINISSNCQSGGWSAGMGRIADVGRTANTITHHGICRDGSS